MIATRFDVMPDHGLFTEDHQALRRGVREWVDRALAPNVEAWEAAGELPHEKLFAEAGEVGIFGAKFDEADGGSGPDLVADAIVTEEVARCGAGGVAAAIGAHKDLGCWYLARLGTQEQKRRWLVPGIGGRLITALAITEPGAGSDVSGLALRAERSGGGWSLTGRKTFITNGPIADVVVVAGRTGPDPHEGITLFAVERGAFEASRIETLGWRTSQTGDLVFEGSAGEVLGEEGRGFHHIMECFPWERLSMALGAVSGAQRTLEEAIAYAKQREAFGRPVARFQVWRHRFADLATEIRAARSLAYAALRKVVAGEDAAREVAMAKWLSGELGWKVADESLQVHGGYGYMKEFAVERHWRDARLGPIGGGTTEIMKELIGRSLGL